MQIHHLQGIINTGELWKKKCNLRSVIWTVHTISSLPFPTSFCTEQALCTILCSTGSKSPFCFNLVRYRSTHSQNAQKWDDSFSINRVIYPLPLIQCCGANTATNTECTGSVCMNRRTDQCCSYCGNPPDGLSKFMALRKRKLPARNGNSWRKRQWIILLSGIKKQTEQTKCHKLLLLFICS